MTKKGVRSVLLVLMVVAFLVFCGVDHALASSSSGLQTFTYDTLRRLANTTDPTGYQVQYTYDAGSRLISSTTPTGTATFAWDLLDRATQVTDPQSHVTSYTYDATSRRLAMLSPNALSTQYTYDASSRITQLRLVNTATTTQLLNLASTYDTNGNALTSGADTYTYDPTQQLSSWTRSGIQTTYTYDPRGNLTSITGPSGTTSFTVDPATNRLLTVTVPGGSTDTWTYDAAGNPLTRTRSQNGSTQVSSYTWDATGKLSSVIRQGDTTLTFAYTPDGRLLQKECGTQVTTYTSDFTGVSRESTTSSAPITYQHNGAGELVSLTWNNQTYTYHFNAHGDTIALSDSTGTLVAQYTYDPWGTLTTTTNPSLPNPYLYCGAWGVRWDSDLGLYLMGARWYNPATGRFLTKDSYPPDLLAPLTQNPYQYCENNPVNNVDPTGRDPTAASSYVMHIGSRAKLANLVDKSNTSTNLFTMVVAVCVATVFAAFPEAGVWITVVAGAGGLCFVQLGIKTGLTKRYQARLLATIGGSNAAVMLEQSMTDYGATDVSVQVSDGKHLATLKCSKDGKDYTLTLVWGGDAVGWTEVNPEGEKP